MRLWIEPTCRNLLRRPLVLGVPFVGLLSLSIAVIAIQSVGQGSRACNALAAVVCVGGYLALRLLTFLGKPGWDEAWIHLLEKALSRGNDPGEIKAIPTRLEILAPDTLDETEAIRLKLSAEERIRTLRKDERLTLLFALSSGGARIREIQVTRSASPRAPALYPNLQDFHAKAAFVYSLVQLPTTTDPLWLPQQLERLNSDLQVIVSIRGLNPHSVSNQVRSARQRNAHHSGIRDVSQEVSFEEATRVLQGLSRGDEWIVEQSVVILSQQELNLDSHYFFREKCGELAILSALGLRTRFHRSHWVRAVTASDLVPNLLDPMEEGKPVLKTPRERALYFDPQDPRLEALHWLVVGASGSGKSFFTGLLLRRMTQSGVSMSALFIDHNRSFRRLVRATKGVYSEPLSYEQVNAEMSLIFECLNQPGAMAGIELSDLPLGDKKGATQWLLSRIEEFLRTRNTLHPVYIVMDECWNFLRDEPVLVQRFFREFRKLNGAAVAITQSLSDFLTNESGRSIFQNAPVRILLRQGEDLYPYRGILGLNEVELSRLKLLRQERGVFSECLIKTPFSSRVARLYPTYEEHELLRTDNIRAEAVREQLAALSMLNRHEGGRLCGGI